MGAEGAAPLTRLQAEQRRLYLPAPDAPADTVRALVVELTGPPGWEPLSRVWRGVQSELRLPAPAIAVSGTDGLQLWFALAEPIAAALGQAFLDRLRRRFLPDVEISRLRLMPGPQAHLVPPRCQPDGNWSAFVAADLAPVFADTPWLDIEPGDEGQAALLHGVAAMERKCFDAAMQALGPGLPATDAAPAATDDPTQFLRRVMNDDSVSLALRIEAAKALLQAQQ